MGSEIKKIVRQLLASSLFTLDRSRKLILGIATLLALVLLGAVYMVILKPPTITAAEKDAPLSRKVFEVAEAEIRKSQPSAPLAALQYAYIATVYDEGIQANGKAGGLYAVHGMIDTIFDSEAAHTALEALGKSYQANYPDEKAPQEVKNIVKTYIARYKSDKHTVEWAGTVPTGNGMWRSASGAEPVEPTAGEWQRWLVNTKVEASAPPAIGSSLDAAELVTVRRAVAARTAEDLTSITYWSGIAGTNTLSGVWQDKLYRELKTDLPKNSIKADKQFAHIQRLSAQAMSDAYMEAWKLKYTYWTASPLQRDATLKTALPDVDAPSFVSEHATVSKTVADVLSIMAPSHADQWELYAKEARNSRLTAGVALDVDARVGFDVGAAVARQAITSGNITKVL